MEPRDRDIRLPMGSQWGWLYRIGGLALVFLGIHVVLELIIIVSVGTAPPTATAEYLVWLQAHRLQQLALLGVITAGALVFPAGYVALFMVLKDADRGLAGLALVISGVAIGIGIVTGVVPGFALARLSEAYVGASTDPQRAVYLAAAEGALAVQTANFLYFLQLFVGTILFSAVMRKAGFPRWLSYLGIGIGVVGIIGTFPAIAFVGIPAVLGFIVWWPAVGYRVYREASASMPTS